LRNLKNDFLKNFEKENDIDGNLIWESFQSTKKKKILKRLKKCYLAWLFRKKTS
jgi:hypothetical protein